MYNGQKVEVSENQFCRDGNAFAIMAVVANALRDQLDMSRDEIEKTIKEYRETTSGDYSKLLAVSLEYVDLVDYDDDYNYDDD